MKQRLLLMVLALGMCSISVSAQQKKRTPVKKTTTTAKPATPTTSKEYKVGNDGFEWYKVKKVVNGEERYGAEDRYGNMIVPTEYSGMWYRSDDNPILTGFGPSKGEYKAWYSKSGKCIVPYSRGYTWIQKWDEDEFGTYYHFVKPDGGGILDRNGREVASVKADGLSYIHIFSMTSNGNTYYYLCFEVTKGGETYSGIADANGRIVVAPEHKEYSTARDLARSRLTTTTNPLAGNRHETLAEAEGRSSGGGGSYSASSSSSSSSSSSNSNNSGGGTTTIVVEQHGPVQVWVPCGGCQFEPGRCTYCHGSGWGYNGRLCSRCGGNGKCTICGGNGGHYEVQYR